MPIHMQCPQCGRKLTAPDSAAGKRARCPQCQNVLTLPAASEAPTTAAVFEAEPVSAPTQAAAAPSTGSRREGGFIPPTAPLQAAPAAVQPPADPARPGGAPPSPPQKPCPMCGEMIAINTVQCPFCQEFVDPAQRAAAGGALGISNDPGWLTTRKGLRVIYVSIVVIFLAAIGMAILAGILGGLRGSGGGAPVMAVAIAIPALVIVAASIAVLVGQFMCCAVPAASGAKVFAIVSAVCILINIVCSIAGQFVPPVAALGSLASLVGSIMFILFLRQLGKHLRHQKLAASAIQFLIFVVVVGAALVGGIVLAAVTRESSAIAIVGLLVLVCMIIGLLWYLRLLAAAVTAIDERGQVRGFPVAVPVPAVPRPSA